ncbi:MAG: DUF362 domain-containing protein [Desulfosalsimonas sp.]
MLLPEMAIFQQNLVSSDIKDAAETTKTALNGIGKGLCEISGDSVAVAVGSRSIDRLDKVVAGIVGFLKNRGANPFILAAMGSHGGATERGQKAVLASYGITEESMGVPVHADPETRPADRLPEGLELHASSTALAADHVVLINRIKPHTKFHAQIESGLCKMLTIGIGNATGAAACHLFAVRNSFSFIESAAERLLGHLKVLFGVGLIEDSFGRLAEIRAIPPESLIDTEKQMLKKARSMLAGIPFQNIDVLIVDRIGKEISGIGMDSNVTGRHRDIAGDFFTPPNPGRIFVRDLSEQSDGNANGIGLADVTTSRLVRRIDMEKTAVNAVTAISPEKAAIPLYFETDKKCLDVCIHTSGIENRAEVGIVRIRDTASLEFLEISKELENKLNPDAKIKRITQWKPLEFNESGNLFPFYPGR